MEIDRLFAESDRRSVSHFEKNISCALQVTIPLSFDSAPGSVVDVRVM